MTDLTIYTAQHTFPASGISQQQAQSFIALFPGVPVGLPVQQPVSVAAQSSGTQYPTGQLPPPEQQQPSPYPAYHPPMYPPPQRPKPIPYRLWDSYLHLWRTHRRAALALAAIVIVIVGSIVVTAGVQGVQQDQQQQAQDASTATAQALVPTDTPVPAPTDTPVPAPTDTPAPAPAPAAIKATHGSPHLGGNISDFYGKFGQPPNAPQAGSDPSGRASMSVGWVTDANNGYLLSMQYYTNTNVVYYISYVGSSNWSKGQYRDYLITNFAPPGTLINAQANQSWASTGGDPYNPIAYDSSIGKFFLHISDGTGNMNTV